MPVDSQFGCGAFDMTVVVEVFLESGDQACVRRVLTIVVLLERIEVLDQQLEFTDTALTRFWKAQHFSYWMTTVLHRGTTQQNSTIRPPVERSPTPPEAAKDRA
jgi:hypothetical protein